MPKGERLFTFLANLMLRKFYGTVIIRFEAGKVTHVETMSRRTWVYRDLPDGKANPAESTGNGDSEAAGGV
jgi:hypothetical protein